MKGKDFFSKTIMFIFSVVVVPMMIATSIMIVAFESLGVVILWGMIVSFTIIAIFWFNKLK